MCLGACQRPLYKDINLFTEEFMDSLTSFHGLEQGRRSEGISFC